MNLSDDASRCSSDVNVGTDDTTTSDYPIRTIAGVDVAVTRRDRAVRNILNHIEAGKPALFGFCNAHTVNSANRSPRFAAALRHHTLFPDGIGMDLASRLLYGSPFPENLNGTDLTPAVLSAARKPIRLFLVGSPPGVAEIAALHMQDDYPGVEVVGTQDGFFDESASSRIAARISLTGADLVLIGMGHPRQELWAAAHGHSTKAVVMSVGAFLDFAAGRVSRAPHWIRRARLEWMFRLVLEPKRLANRYLIGNFRFLARAFWGRATQRRR